MRRRNKWRAGAVCIGTDLINISDVVESIDTFGDRYLARVYSPQEIATCRDADGAPSASRLAARFAAKESMIKALRPGIGLDYADIEVTVDATGAPTMSCSGTAGRWFDGLRLSTSSVTMTHDGDYAAAVYVAMSN